MSNWTRIRYHERVSWFIMRTWWWLWKLELDKECVTTFMSNKIAQIFWCLSSMRLIFGHFNYSLIAMSRGVGVLSKLWAWAWVERRIVHILVVVAIIKMRTLKSEVDKVFIRTAIGHGWLDSKILINNLQMSFGSRSKKGKWR